jgi:predicted transcriptional regulator
MLMTKTVMSESVTFRIPADVLSNIDVIAEATERSRSYIIVRALRTYLLYEGSDILAALKGREQTAAGESEDMDDVLTEMDRIIAGKVA